MRGLVRASFDPVQAVSFTAKPYCNESATYLLPRAEAAFLLSRDTFPFAPEAGGVVSTLSKREVETATYQQHARKHGLSYQHVQRPPQHLQQTLP